jgi:recombination protein RecA
VPTQIIGIDWLLGGGVPKGRITEISGEENSGKTTLAAEITKAFQHEEERVLYLDYEHSVDLGFFKKIGVEISNEAYFLYEQPFSLDEGVETILKLVRTGEIGLLIIDSIAAMVPKQELEGEFTDQTIALQARLISRFCRDLIGPLGSTNTAAIFINQTRSKIGGFSPQPNPQITCGGNAIKFYSSIRFTTKRIEAPKLGGIRCRATLKKQKTCFSTPISVEYEITKTGIDHYGALCRAGLDTGVVVQKGGKILHGETQVAGSSAEFIAKIEADQKLRAKISAEVLSIWNKTDLSIVEE